MKRSFTSFILALLCISCMNRNEQHVSRFHDDGRAKPVVALVPIFDRSESTLPWDLSEEFTATIEHRFQKMNNFFLSTPLQIHNAVTCIDSATDPFGVDLSWAKSAFKKEEFLILIELVEHKIHPKEAKNAFFDKFTPSNELDVTMRLRVIDLRKSEPKIILQEILHHTHFIPKLAEDKMPTPDKWRHKTYAVSPLGFAHLQISKEVAKRIDQYIGLAKSKG